MGGFCLIIGFRQRWRETRVLDNWEEKRGERKKKGPFPLLRGVIGGGRKGRFNRKNKTEERRE